MDYTYPFIIFRPSMVFQPPMLVFTSNNPTEIYNSEDKNIDSNRTQEFTEEKAQKELQRPNQAQTSLSSVPKPQTKPSNQKASEMDCQQSSKKKRQTDSFTEKRNIIPNNVNHIIAYIQRKSKSEPVVRKIIDKSGENDPRLTIKRFYCYMTYLKQKLNVHVNRKTLKVLTRHLDLDESIFTIREQLFFNKVSRTLVCHYLKEEAKLALLSSNRVRLTNKIDHLAAHRSLLLDMKQNDD